MFSRLLEMIRRVLSRMFPYRTVEQAEKISTPLSADMKNAIDKWRDIYVNKSPWLDDKIFSLNLGSMISAEIARQILLEFKWNITSPKAEETDEDTLEEALETAPDNDRVVFLRNETERLKEQLMRKLEQGLASGSMIIKPYIKADHIYYDFAMGWDVYPVSFDDDGNLSDVIFCDQFKTGDEEFTRLERHSIKDGVVTITNRCFKRDTSRDSNGITAPDLGEEVPLTDVPQWADLQAEVTIENASGLLFGFFKTATSNSVDVNGPMGISIYSKAVDTIKQADIQYSRMLWEYEGTELAIHVDVNAFKNVPESNERDLAHLRDRLYRKIDQGTADTYEVFSPTIRDTAYLSGLNVLLMRIEDQCGISRGTLSDANAEARTATELKILKERTYTTIHSNQMALERCLRDTLRAVNEYATIYDLTADGEYDTSFEWDDSIITDTTQQLNERMELYSNKMISRVEMRMWYFGETKAQALKAIREIDENDRQTDVETLLENRTEAYNFGDAQNQAQKQPVTQENSDDRQAIG